MPGQAPATPIAFLLDRLVGVIAPRGRVMTAYSGGIDSTLVAVAAHRALGADNALAVIGDSPSLPRYELDEAVALADRLGLNLRVVEPNEQHDPGYQRNSGDRCYFCKTHLYDTLHRTAKDLGYRYIANGTNADDLGDHRPGLVAAEQAQIISPLIEAALDKQAVRELARHLGLPNADKPAAACLASRIPYGTEVTLERLAQVEQAEDALRALGLTGFRVRHHEQVARIELPMDQVPRLMDPKVREKAVTAIKNAGFAFVSLDLEGFRSGSGNVLLTIGGNHA